MNCVGCQPNYHLFLPGTQFSYTSREIEMTRLPFPKKAPPLTLEAAIVQK